MEETFRESTKSKVISFLSDFTVVLEDKITDFNYVINENSLNGLLALVSTNLALLFLCLNHGLIFYSTASKEKLQWSLIKKIVIVSNQSSLLG